MRIKIGQEMATGLLFILVGIGALIIGKDYAMGQWNRPGTGVLPAILSVCLIFTGGILAFKSYASGDSEITGLNLKPLIIITASVVLFGLTIDHLGLVIAMILSMSLCAYGIAETKWGEFAVFLAIMIVGAWLMFICMLGMPINTCPAFAECNVCWLVKRPMQAIYSMFNWLVR